MLFCAIIGSSCEDCSREMDNATFDDFAASVLYMLISGDELTLNFYFENPENEFDRFQRPQWYVDKWNIQNR